MNYKRFQRNLIHLTVIDSTNNYAANLIKEVNVANGATILTKRQANGKGQRGNSWQSDEGKNLTLSTVVFPGIKVTDSFYLNIAVSLAIRKTLEDLKIVSQIKWPNDIYVRDQKICGILIETQIQGKQIQNAILGIGLNVNQMHFSNSIKAVSIAQELGHEMETEVVFDQLYYYLDFYIDLLMQQNFPLLLKLYYKFMYGLNVPGKFEDTSGVFEGTIQGVDTHGRLLIKVSGNGELRSYDIKEVAYQVQV